MKGITLAAITPGTLVGDIMRLYPKTPEMMTRHNVDLYCEAGDPLEVVERAHSLELGRYLEELNQVIEGR